DVAEHVARRDAGEQPIELFFLFGGAIEPERTLDGIVARIAAPVEIAVVDVPHAHARADQLADLVARHRRVVVEPAQLVVADERAGHGLGLLAGAFLARRRVRTKKKPRPRPGLS